MVRRRTAALSARARLLEISGFRHCKEIRRGDPANFYNHWHVTCFFVRSLSLNLADADASLSGPPSSACLVALLI